jgi:hypothetical protein
MELFVTNVGTGGKEAASSAAEARDGNNSWSGFWLLNEAAPSL